MIPKAKLQQENEQLKAELSKAHQLIDKWLKMEKKKTRVVFIKTPVVEVNRLKRA